MHMGVSLLDVLLRASTSNKAQYESLYKNYFKIYLTILCNDKRDCSIFLLIVKNIENNKPENFVTRFKRPIILDNNSEYEV